MELELYQALTEAGIHPDSAHRIEKNVELAITQGQESLRTELFTHLMTKPDGLALRNEFKSEMHGLKVEMSEHRAEFKNDIHHLKDELRSEFKSDLSHLRNEVKSDIQELEIRLTQEFKKDLGMATAPLHQSISEITKSIADITQTLQTVNQSILGLHKIIHDLTWKLLLYVITINSIMFSVFFKLVQ